VTIHLGIKSKLSLYDEFEPNICNTIVKARDMYTTIDPLRPLKESLQTQIPTKTLSLVMKQRSRIKNENKWEKGCQTLYMH